jgi:hypothetical protein
MTTTAMTATLPHHSLAFETGQAYETAPVVKAHAHVLAEHPVTPGLNYGYVGYCSICGIAAWE